MSLRIKLLGVLQIEDETGKISEVMKSNKGCALLAYLLVTNVPQPREVLADLLWDATSTVQSLQNLRALLTRMRKWVPELEVTRKQVRFPMETAVSFDYNKLLTGLDSGEQHEITSVLPLYQGDLLDGFYLEDAPRFNAWLLLTREKLRQRVVGAFRQLCAVYQEQQDWVKGVALAKCWLALDELDEEALRHLLHLLAASGQLDVALQQYETSRQQLWDELSVEPMDETQQLATQIAQLKETHGDGLSWSRVVGIPAQLPTLDELPKPGNLPTNAFVPYQRNPDFTGRKETLLHLAQLLLPQTGEAMRRAAAVTGMGGLGKTQLAVEFCYRYGRFFPGGVFWLSFADVPSLAEEIDQIGGERGMGLYREADNLRQADKVGRVLKAWQEPIPRLLIFDNCEEEALLAKWLPVTGGCSVLLTSRHAHWSREMEVAEWLLPVLDVNESVQLLQNLAPHLTPVDAASIASKLGHLPLGLHLAGSFLRRYREITADQYLSQLNEKNLFAHPSLQGRGTDYSPTGHELDLARTFAVNWEQLDATNETDALALQLIACAVHFAPDEPLPRDLLLAAAQVDEHDLMTLLLAEDSLVRLLELGFMTMSSPAAYRVHRLVATFVGAQLEDVAASTVTTAVAQTIWYRLQNQWDTETSLDQLVVAPAQVHYVMEVELAKESVEAIHLAHAWGHRLLDIGDYASSRAYLEKALVLSEKLYGAEHPETADILTTLGVPIWKADSERVAHPYLERALSIYEQAFGIYHLKTAKSLMSLAILYARMDEYEKAIAHYQQTLHIYEQLLPPDHPEIFRTIFNLAVAYRRMGNYRMALPHYETALCLREKLWPEDNPRILNALSGIGFIHLLIGNYETALDYLQKVLVGREARLGHQHPQTARSLGNMGSVLGFLGQHDDAISYLQEALTIHEHNFGLDHAQLVHTLTYLGFVLQAKGELAAARPILERGLAIQETNQLENEQTVETLAFLAAVLMQLEEMEIARCHLQRALDILAGHQELKQSRIAVAYIYWGEWQEAQGNREAAITFYEQALNIMGGQVAETHFGWQRAKGHLARLGEAKERPLS